VVCRTARQALTRRGDADEAIHEARKAIRRLRSLLAVARDRVEGIEAIDDQLDRLGDGLSALRDAYVVVATSRELSTREDASGWPDAIDRLARERDALLARERARDPGFARRKRAIARIERRLRTLSWQVRKPDLRAALKRGQRRVETAGERAEANPRPRNLHRWRRRVRRLRMQLVAAQALAPGLAREVAEPSLKKQLRRLHDLAEALGRYQDLQVLRARLRRMPAQEEPSQLLAGLDDARLLAWLDFTPDRERAAWIRQRGGFGADG
jgi:CHAD domain-containing protein